MRCEKSTNSADRRPRGVAAAEKTWCTKSSEQGHLEPARGEGECGGTVGKKNKGKKVKETIERSRVRGYRFRRQKHFTAQHVREAGIKKNGTGAVVRYKHNGRKKPQERKGKEGTG